MAASPKSSRLRRRGPLYLILRREMSCERQSKLTSIADRLSFEREVGDEFGACCPAAIHEAQVQTRRYFAELVAYVAPHERSGRVIHDDGGAAIKPTCPVANPGLDGLHTGPL